MASEINRSAYGQKEYSDEDRLKAVEAVTTLTRQTHEKKVTWKPAGQMEALVIGDHGFGIGKEHYSGRTENGHFLLSAPSQLLSEALQSGGVLGHSTLLLPTLYLLIPSQNKLSAIPYVIGYRFPQVQALSGLHRAVMRQMGKELPRGSGELDIDDVLEIVRRAG